MKPDAYLRAVAREADALVAAAASELAAPVEACPEWTTTELLAHIGTVHRWAANLVRDRVREPSWDRERLPEGDDPVAWARSGTEILMAVLEETDPAQPVWGWAGSGTAAFWFRRMAHETALHRWDAEHAVAKASDVDGDLAADGIDELLDDLLQTPFFRPKLASAGETLHLHRTDGDGEWLLRFGDDGLSVSHEHAKGDAAVRASASDLLLLLWNRLDLSSPALEAFGDPSVVDHWRQRFPI